LGRIEGGEVESKFTARDICAKCWRRLSDPAEVKEAVELLTEYRYLEQVKMQTGGRAKSLYIVSSQV
jgi:hypothetical protein